MFQYMCVLPLNIMPFFSALPSASRVGMVRGLNLGHKGQWNSLQHVVQRFTAGFAVPED